MTFHTTTKSSPLSPSQPSPVGASAFTPSGPTRSGCGVSGTRPLSPNPEVQRSDQSVHNSESSSVHAAGSEWIRGREGISSCFVSFQFQTSKTSLPSSITGGKMP